MSECCRNTRLIVEAAIKVLYGTQAKFENAVPAKEFGDTAGLESSQPAVCSRPSLPAGRRSSKILSRIGLVRGNR